MTHAMAAPPPVTLREVASGLDQPTEIVNAGDGSGRLFIVEKTGLIRILRNGSLLATPFLDVRSQVSTSSEQGLLGLAFHPRYASNGRFFVYYTERNSGALHVSAFQVSATNADVGDAASERTLLTVPHPGFANHNGGRLAFGPDRHLYIGTGDGGSGGDPPNNAQDLGVLLGKLLRMNVDDASPAAEIWAYGLRNPWKFTFDRVAGDLYIADVGQGRIEEIDFVPFGTPAGLNFGWRVFEGAECFGGGAPGCALANHTPPVITYGHDNAGGQSVTGGYVYRGNASIALRGYYLYGDFESNRMWAARREDGQWRVSVVVEPGALSGISTFGEDEAGELYVASFGDGRIFAITAPGPGANPLERSHVDAAGNAVGNPWGRRAR